MGSNPIAATKLKIDIEEIDRRYVDFEALAKRLEECIDKDEAMPSDPVVEQPE